MVENKKKLRGDTLRKQVLACVLAGAVVLAGCEEPQKDVQKEVTVASAAYAEEKVEILSYEEYSELFLSMTENLEIPGYTLLNTSTDTDIIMIDKEISFNKREYLTLDGTYDNKSQVQTSQESLFFGSEDRKTALIITIAYTDAAIGEDIVSYVSSGGYGLPEEVIQKSDLITLSYKNLIISVLQSAEKTVVEEDTTLAAEQLVEFLGK